jgi:F-type H+-transporting ATPase subunit a
VSLLTLAAAAREGFELPPIDHLFKFPPFLFEDSPLFAFNRTALLYLLARPSSVGLMLAAFAKPSIVPGKFQAAMEGLVDLVRDNIVARGHRAGRLQVRAVPDVVVPVHLREQLLRDHAVRELPVHGRMALPALLAIMVWTVFMVVGMKAQGGLKYFKNAVDPPASRPRSCS